jgi:hypothetical protein
VPLVVEQDDASHPLQVLLLGAIAVMEGGQGLDSATMSRRRRMRSNKRLQRTPAGGRR